MDDRGTVALELQDIEEARRLLDAASEIRARLLGPNHPHVAITKLNRAVLA
ncbi:MAG: tetratricopeptide repeat protein [Planctomycetota bacterium]